MEINAREFLTPEQKSALGTAFFEKMMNGIEGIEFSKSNKLNIGKLIQYEIGQIFDNGDVYDHVDFKQVGKILTKKIVDGI